MTEPAATAPKSPVPTSQRPLNGAVSGGGALLIDQLARAVLTHNGVAPELSAVLAPVAGMVTSGVMATVGDAARAQIESQPPQTFVGRLFFGLLSRIG